MLVLSLRAAESLDAQAGQQEDQLHLTSASRGLIYHLQTPELARHKQLFFFPPILSSLGNMVRPCVSVVSVILSVISGTSVKIEMKVNLLLCLELSIQVEDLVK